MPVVPFEIHDMTVAYHRKPVLWDIDLTVPEGKLVGIVGPNGAGKSTLIKAALGLVPLASGKVEFYGLPYARQRHLVGYVPQRESVDWDFPVSALDVVLMGTYGRLGWLRRPGAGQRELVEQCLEQVELAQFANRQRDGIFLARNGDMEDPLPTGHLHRIPYGCGALKINTVYLSLVEALLVPHVSDNQKSYETFPLRDLYLGGSVGVTGLLFEALYVSRERLALHAATGLNVLGWFNAPRLAPLNYYVFPLHLGAGVRFGPLMQRLLGENRWCTGADLLLGFGDGDGDDATPSLICIPGVFLEIEKRDLFGWGSGWDGFTERGDHREDPRPDNYHVRALYARAALYVDLQTGRESGYVELNTAVGFRYNARGPRIPEHEFKETRVVYVNAAYEDQIRMQRERRLERMQKDPREE